MRKCYVCDKFLNNQNETWEHIILNSLGGRLKSRDLICRSCNSTFGSKVDDQLSQQLGMFPTILNIKRDRGEPKNIVCIQENREIILMPSGKMSYRKPEIIKNENSISISISSENEARKVLEGLKRSNPKIDVERTLSKAERSTIYAPIMIDFKFGDSATKRAFCKMAINYYMYNNGERKNIEHLIPYILEENEECSTDVLFVYPKDDFFKKNENQIMHSLLLVGDPTNKVLYTYIELFNEFKVIIYLNKDYSGKWIHQTYHYDILSNSVIEYEDKIFIKLREFRRNSFLKLDEISIPKFQHRQSYLLQRINNYNQSRLIRNIVEKVFNEASKKFDVPEGGVFEGEEVDYISRRVGEEVTSYLKGNILNKNRSS